MRASRCVEIRPVSVGRLPYEEVVATGRGVSAGSTNKVQECMFRVWCLVSGDSWVSYGIDDLVSLGDRYGIKRQWPDKAKEPEFAL